MHIVNFQRDLVVRWIIHTELKVPLLIEFKDGQKNYSIYMLKFASLSL
jgi:hypothetical protein